MKTIALTMGILTFLFIGLFALGSSSGKGPAKPEPAGLKTAVFAVS
ncbi:MAG TPA: hypothetical protein PLW65_14675 [Pseudomonadota bacterium]|nr:hypothetical protein [Pseudomonadota bacterium]